MKRDCSNEAHLILGVLSSTLLYMLFLSFVELSCVSCSSLRSSASHAVLVVVIAQINGVASKATGAYSHNGEHLAIRETPAEGKGEPAGWARATGAPRTLSTSGGIDKPSRPKVWYLY
jgi:hypothetical protein